jgi:hypothetical protein
VVPSRSLHPRKLVFDAVSKDAADAGLERPLPTSGAGHDALHRVDLVLVTVRAPVFVRIRQISRSADA